MNYAFIDNKNLSFGLQELGWRLDYRRFLVHLREKYGVSKAFLFVHYRSENHQAYTYFEELGYTVIFNFFVRGFL